MTNPVGGCHSGFAPPYSLGMPKPRSIQLVLPAKWDAVLERRRTRYGLSRTAFARTLVIGALDDAHPTADKTPRRDPQPHQPAGLQSAVPAPTEKS